jgi:hypothetical protein
VSAALHTLRLSGLARAGQYTRTDWTSSGKPKFKVPQRNASKQGLVLALQPSGRNPNHQYTVSWARLTPTRCNDNGHSDTGSTHTGKQQCIPPMCTLWSSAYRGGWQTQGGGLVEVLTGISWG